MEPLPNLAHQISSLLNSRKARKLNLPHQGLAAVLMPIFQESSAESFLLTLRTGKVETHKNQISFPGGVQEAHDHSLVQTALRETWEEIGLAPEDVHILGEFDEYQSITGLIVTPIVGWIAPPQHLSPNPDEVEEILRVPWSVFRDHRRLRVETKKRLEEEKKIYFYQFEEKEVWGLTAQIIRDFLKLVDSLNFSFPPGEKP
ncbi:MAG: CoA pyrophosphatase [Terriglobia bacterium]